MTGLVRFSSGCYTVSASVGALPALYSAYVEHALLSEDLGPGPGGGTPLFVAVEQPSREWPALVVALRFAPSAEAGFHPGILMIPEMHTLFVGAGTRLVAYALSPLRQLWEDSADCGFWKWERHDDVVLMAA